MDRQEYCIKCYRSRDERFNWLNYSNHQKQGVLRLCKQWAIRRYYQFL
ncbi:hypothetical protein B6D18_10090 [Gilliamella sp. A7]|nr:hypothetical protein B6D18_10090 [Gilliamella sp. A7]